MESKKAKVKRDPIAFTKREREEVNSNAWIIETMFYAFFLEVKVMGVTSYRNYIEYAIQIEPGTSVEDILKHKRDLALYLISPTGKVKMVAPIPNKTLIGIQLPRRKKHQTKEREYLLREFTKAQKDKLIDDGINFLLTKKSPMVSAIYFKQFLNIDLQSGIVIFNELRSLGILYNLRTEDITDQLVCDVDLEKLKKYRVN